MYKILLIEDDQSIRDKIKNKLEDWDYKITQIKDFKNVEEIFISDSPDLVMIDINLPYYDGFHWCKCIRKLSKVPIMMISARDSSMDQIMAMDLGADDYIVKPFYMEVLVAKIKALLRRNYAYKDSSLNLLTYESLKLQLSMSQLINGDEIIELTKNEMVILESFFNDPNRIHERSELMHRLWQSDAFVDDNTLSVNINRLRKKLSDYQIKDLILTKKGIGYYLNESF
ncbi:MAG TPA: response regulator transcription factor [Clostridia bacterium]|nr:response regulator transcription factor [Clostridia bacterium]